MDVTRRTLTRTAGWSVPVISVAAAAPAFAASTPIVVPNSKVDVTKCPGQSDKTDPWTYIATFITDSPVSSVTVASFTVNGVVFPIERVVADGNSFHVVTQPSTNSADAAGTGVIYYNTGGVDRTFEFAYNGSHPNQQLCRRV
jgi:hypothetical protein